MNTIRNTKRPKLATILAAIALFIVVGGTATAASGLINGKKIKAGTITAKQIKNKTITQGKLAPSTVAALRGAQGPKGEKGEKGEKGNTGAPGIPGTSDLITYQEDQFENNVPANTDRNILEFSNMPSSKYLIMAKVVMFSQTAGIDVRCILETNNNGGGDEARWTSTGNSHRTTVPLLLSTTAKVTYITVDCNGGAALSAFNANAIVIPVS